MKKIVSAAWVLALLVVSGSTSYAWHVDGYVLCGGSTPIGGVHVHVTGTDTCGNTFDQTAVTDSSQGYYSVDLEVGCTGTGSFQACINMADLPPGATLDTAACTSFTLTFGGQDTARVSWNVTNGECTPPPPSCPPVSSCIRSGFNGTPIGPNYYIWFNSVIKVSGRDSNPATINFAASTVTFGSTTVTLPPAVITFDVSATQASSTFSGGAWHTIVPATYSGNVFLSGVALQVPGGLPGGVSPVTWCGNFSADQTGLKANWQWAAAVYQCFSTDLTQVGVKPVDANNLSIYQNSDHAGTPENFKNCVTGGARGGGGSNWTGSYSATGGVILCQ